MCHCLSWFRLMQRLHMYIGVMYEQELMLGIIPFANEGMSLALEVALLHRAAGCRRELGKL